MLCALQLLKDTVRAKIAFCLLLLPLDVRPSVCRMMYVQSFFQTLLLKVGHSVLTLHFSLGHVVQQKLKLGHDGPVGLWMCKRHVHNHIVCELAGTSYSNYVLKLFFHRGIMKRCFDKSYSVFRKVYRSLCGKNITLKRLFQV